MSKWILLAGLAFLALGTAAFFLVPVLPVLENWYWPLFQPGIVLTVLGSGLLMFRGDW